MGTPERTEGTPDRPRVRAETLYALLVVLTLAGLAAASFAAYEVVDPAITKVCSPDPFFSCSKVLASGHTNILGIPDWSIGVTGYVVMLGLAVAGYRTFDRRYLQTLAVLSALGMCVVAYLVYTELFVVGAVCPVCSTAHALNVGVLAVSLVLLRMSRSEGTPEPGPAAPPGPPADAGGR